MPTRASPVGPTAKKRSICLRSAGTDSPRRRSPTRRRSGTLMPTSGVNVPGRIQKSWARSGPAARMNTAAAPTRTAQLLGDHARTNTGGPPRTDVFHLIYERKGDLDLNDSSTDASGELPTRNWENPHFGSRVRRSRFIRTARAHEASGGHDSRSPPFLRRSPAAGGTSLARDGGEQARASRLPRRRDDPDRQQRARQPRDEPDRPVRD